MARLSPARAEALKRLFASVSDDILKTLDSALTLGAADCPSTFAAAAHARSEREERRLRDHVFAPLLPLARPCREGVDTAAAARLPFNPAPDLWRLLRRTDARTITEALTALRDGDAPELGPDVVDELTALAAERLATHPEWSLLRERLHARSEDATARLSRALELAPVVRRTIGRARALTRAPSDAHAAALRLAYRDAEARTPGAGLVLLAMLAADLERPWQVMRLISAVMDRPSDTFLASTEFGAFALAVLADVDARLAALRAFDGATGPEGGAAAGAAVFTCALEVVELEQSLTLDRDGPWGRRVRSQKQELARIVEQHLKGAVQWLDRVLPVHAKRLGGRVRGAPRLDDAFDVPAAQRTLGLLAFLDGVRTSASFGGFATTRSRIIEELDGRLDQYVEDLLELLRSEDEHAGVRERLHFAGDCLGMVREPRAAELVRRRAAAA